MAFILNEYLQILLKGLFFIGRCKVEALREYFDLFL